jgi:acyl-CoA synthetase (AMP-forming)/AMP-acid ligase II
LQSLGVGSSDRVGSLAHNSDRQVETCMAVPWAGAVINPCNTRWSATEIACSLAELPRNATGKVLKRTLRQPHWEGHDRQVA